MKVEVHHEIFYFIFTIKLWCASALESIGCDLCRNVTVFIRRIKVVVPPLESFHRMIYIFIYYT